MRFLRTLLLISTIICSAAAVPAYAQKKQKQPAPTPPECAVKQRPQLRGFSLGMNLAEVRNTLSDTTLFDSKLSAGNSVGSRAVRISGAELKAENADGVDDVDLTFIDDKLSVIRITYNSAMRWEGAEDFFSRVAESMGLPKPSATEMSQGSSRGNEKYKIECKAFSVSLAYSFGVTPNVTLADSLAQKAVKERREQQGEGEVKEIRITPRRPPP